MRDLVTGLPTDTPAERRNRQIVAGWLFTIAAMVWAMTVLGGATRLTGSGLSIMEWAPLAGALPPLSHAEWQRLFALYRQIPQYSLLHQGMGLAGFQGLFWLEWAHRLLGRLIGLAFLVPLVWLWAAGRIERTLRPRLVLLLLLGAAQGAAGWFMVASGFFPASTAVSPYRLVVHLAVALVLFGSLIWTALSVLRPAPVHLDWAGARVTRRLAEAAVALVGLTVLAGGFTAGLHAGFAYNTFPLMEGRLVPRAYADLQPFWRNLTENVAAVQFDHRLLATATALTVLATAAIGLCSYLPRRIRAVLWLLAAAVAAQYCLGVSTLLLVVPMPLAVAHQGMAMLLLAAALASAHALRGACHQRLPESLRRARVREPAAP
ncbi:MAG: COX15/CtaA family protein [Alphaproteobacteria bacterium]|nr:COX15/CtaA family protein [Alphaproteobacteria bacterium]